MNKIIQLFLMFVGIGLMIFINATVNSIKPASRPPNISWPDEALGFILDNTHTNLIDLGLRDDGVVVWRLHQWR